MKPTLFQKLRSAFKTSSSQSLNTKETTTPQWYKSDYNREQAENYLLAHEIGTFVIRKSETIQDCHVLSVKVPKYINASEISHYLIVKSKSTSLSSLHQAKKSSKSVYSVRGYNKEFSDLKSLVTHCSFMRDIIPVTLNLEFYRERAEQQAGHRHNDFFYYSSSTSSLTASESGSGSDADSLNSELC
jgi:hypothetical protein